MGVLRFVGAVLVLAVSGVLALWAALSVAGYECSGWWFEGCDTRNSDLGWIVGLEIAAIGTAVALLVANPRGWVRRRLLGSRGSRILTAIVLVAWPILGLVAVALGE